MVKGAIALTKKTAPTCSGGMASDSDSVLDHGDRELEDEERLLDEEEELECMLGKPEATLESLDVPSLSDAS